MYFKSKNYKNKITKKNFNLEIILTIKKYIYKWIDEDKKKWKLENKILVIFYNSYFRFDIFINKKFLKKN